MTFNILLLQEQDLCCSWLDYKTSSSAFLSLGENISLTIWTSASPASYETSATNAVCRSPFWDCEELTVSVRVGLSQPLFICQRCTSAQTAAAAAQGLRLSAASLREEQRGQVKVTAGLGERNKLPGFLSGSRSGWLFGDLGVWHLLHLSDPPAASVCFDSDPGGFLQKKRNHLRV